MSGITKKRRTGIGWQEILAVLSHFFGLTIYCVCAKQPIEKKVLVVLTAFVIYGGLFTAAEIERVISEPVSRSSLPSQQAPSTEQAAKAILNQIESQYGFSRFIDTWGMGTYGLYIPEEAWYGLSPSQQQTLIDYAQSNSFEAILVGRLKGSNNMSIDRTVWERY